MQYAIIMSHFAKAKNVCCCVSLTDVEWSFCITMEAICDLIMEGLKTLSQYQEFFMQRCFLLLKNTTTSPSTSCQDLNCH